MKIAIVLGYRLKDDGDIADTLKQRLDMTLELYQEYHPEKIIVSGGIANLKAGISEASKMKDYLVEHGIPTEQIIEENQSTSTYENAKFSIPIALKFHPDTIFLCTTIEHLARKPYNAIQYFSDWINEVDPLLTEDEKKDKRNIKNIRLVIYSKC